MAEPNWAVSPDRQQLALTVPTQPVASVFALGAAGVENLIKHLIEARAAMEPKVPITDPAPGTEVMSAAQMRWWVQPSAEDPRMLVLCLSHPGLGWIGISLDRDGCQELMKTIERCLPPPRPSIPLN